MALIVKNLNVRGKLVAGTTPSTLDVTPNPTPNWDNGLTIYPDQPTTDTQTIQGINTSIDLYWVCVIPCEAQSVEYSKNSGTWTAIGDSVNFSVNNNDTLAFRSIFGGSGGFQQIEVRNNSDNGAILDTIFFECQPN